MLKDESLKEKIVDHAIKLSFGTALKGVGQFINQYFAAFLLGPATFGVWQGVKLILGYGGVLGMGTLEGMHREIPISRGKGDDKKISDIKNVTFIYNFIATVFLSSVIFAITFFINVGPQIILSLRFIALILFIQFFRSFVEGWLKANNCFGIISRLAVIDGIGLALSVVLIFYFSFLGFLAGYTLSVLVGTIYAFLKTKISIDLEWNSKIFKTLMVIGFPIMVIGISSALFQTVDRLLILKFLDAESLGFYSLGWLAFMPITFIFYAATSIMYPRFSERFGRTNNDEDLKNFMILPTKYLAFFTPILIGGILVILPIAVKLFLPEYTGGINIAKILFFGLFFESIVGMAGNFFLATNRQIFYLGVFLVSSLVNLILGLILLSFGFGILGVAIGTSTSYVVFFLIMLNALMVHCKFNWREKVKFFLQISLPLIYVFVVSLLIEKFVNINGGSISILIKSAVLKEFIFLFFSSYLIYFSFKNLEIKKYFVKK